MTRKRILIVALVLAVLFLVLGWVYGHKRAKAAAGTSATNVVTSTEPNELSKLDPSPTLLYAHNLMLRKGPDFRIYIGWVRGRMRRTKEEINPSFDDPASFVLEIDKGVIHANIGDVSHFLNVDAPDDAPLKNITIRPDGEQLVISGTVHKIVPLPVEVRGTLDCTPDGRVKFHLTKMNILKVPVKGLLGSFHIELANLVHTGPMPGVQIKDNDIYFDTQTLLPPPHIHGQLTSVRVVVPDIEVVYGHAPVDETKMSQWHNFLKLTGGTLDFGKLTMHHVDLIMIDASKDPWFNLDLVNYQAQLVNGYTRMTPQAGLEIFMPDLDEQAIHKKASPPITLEWLKNRNQSLPPDIPVK